MNRTSIFHDKSFWQHFQKQVQFKSWKCDFSSNMLLENLPQDSKLYKDDSVLKQRRQDILSWIDNDQWEKVILEACDELAGRRSGPHSQILKNLHMFDAFSDFVEHLNYFYTVASTMSIQGQTIQPISQYSSQVHDIDKLDPIMLLGYSERFEDNIATSVWEVCVERHVHMNPHHQAHYVWHNCYQDAISTNIRTEALREMVCDKVSRRLQKNLGGVVCGYMWDVEDSFFQGLPELWMEKASGVMKLMRQNGVSLGT